MEKLIPISRKQHDAINTISESIAANQKQLSTVASVILLGQEEELGQVGVVGARFVKQAEVGSHEYFLVLEIPDITPEVKEA